MSIDETDTEEALPDPERMNETEPGEAGGGQLEEIKVIFKVWSCVRGRDVKGYKCNIYFVIA